MNCLILMTEGCFQLKKKPLLSDVSLFEGIAVFSVHSHQRSSHKIFITSILDIFYHVFISSIRKYISSLFHEIIKSFNTHFILITWGKCNVISGDSSWLHVKSDEHKWTVQHWKCETWRQTGESLLHLKLCMHFCCKMMWVAYRTFIFMKELILRFCLACVLPALLNCLFGSLK